VEQCESNELCPNEATYFGRMNSCGDHWWSCEEHYQIIYGDEYPPEWVWAYDDFTERMKVRSGWYDSQT